MADILLLALQGSNAPTIIFAAGSSTVTVTPELLASLMPSSDASAALASAPADPSPAATPSIEDQIRALMLQVIALLQELLRRLSA